MQAALTFSFAAMGAIVAIMALGPLMDRFGPKAAVVSAVIAVVVHLLSRHAGARRPG